MKTVGRIIYYCEICNTGYDKARDAKNCEKRKAEKATFKKGNKVKIIGYKMACTLDGTNRSFYGVGKIVKVTGLRLQDEEYAYKWLSALTNNVDNRIEKLHIRMYEVEFKCLCGEKRSALVYAPELKKVKTR